MQVSIEAKRRAYAAWLRSGRWPVMRGADGTEWKFNPYHDPKDGRFTTAGGGGVAAAASSKKKNRLTPLSTKDVTSHANRSRLVESKAPPPYLPSPIETSASFSMGAVKGVADGLSGVKDTVLALSTHPISTVEKSSLSLAGSIDQFISDEDKPTVDRLKNAALIIAQKHPFEAGHFIGSSVPSCSFIVVLRRHFPAALLWEWN